MSDATLGSSRASALI